ncbi:MAG: hypothetical protein FD168_1058 [Desulfobulbaceae bacterium]|nr:MAG: hypothetical protein FD168_1058 [Desulfobulbaceae bacterium]
MIKGQIGKIVLGKHVGLGSIVSCLGCTFSLGDKDRGRGVLAGITSGIGIGVKLSQALHRQAGFFLGFAGRRRFKGLAIIDKPARQGPAVWWVFTFDKDDCLTDLNDDINRGNRIAKTGNLGVAVWTVHK